MIYRSYSKILNRDLSCIGFGGWGIGGPSDGCMAYGSVSDSTSKTALKAAYDNGINFFDTSNIYGMGKSEELIGSTLANVREDVIIATKVGRISGGQQCFDVTSLKKSFFESLKRMKTDYIDLLQLHDPLQSFALNEEVLEFMLDLKSAGFVRSIGASLKSPEYAQSFIDSEYWDIIQINFNLIDQRALESNIFENASKSGKEIIVRTPLAFGFLAAHHDTDCLRFPEGDHRSQWSLEQLKLWASAPDKFAEICNELNMDIGELAIKFAATQYPTISCLVGMLNPGEVMKNIRGMSQACKLPDLIIKKIRDVYANNEFFIKS